MSRRHTQTGGSSQRQRRVGELIRRVLSDILRQGKVHDPALDALSITVGEVVCTADLRLATVYVMPLMGSAGTEEVLRLLSRHAGELRHLIGREVNLKYAPQLRFRADETYDQLDATRRLFSDPAVRRDIESGHADAGDSDPRDDAEG